MCSVLWSAFTWEAFATLFTGLAAVVGAVYIGHRQLRISELTVRTELFDKRFEYYKLFEKYLSAVRSTEGEISLELQNEFLAESRKAELIFPTKITPEIDEIWNKGFEYKDLQEDLASQDSAKSDAARGRRKEIRADLDAAYKRFQEIASKQIRLV